MRSLIAIAICLIAMTACAENIDTAEWTEEVKLSDGRMVVVWRKDRAARSGFPNARRGRLIDFELKYPPMNMQWYDKTSPTHVRHPMSFDIIDGVPHFVLYIADREGCRSRPGSDYSAQFLKWIDGRWLDVPQVEFPVDRMPMNLFQEQWGHTTKEDADGLITWGQKFGTGTYRHEPVTVKQYFERGARTCANNLAI
jgi:hypothetical protein